jgi:hypothetical protein
MGYSVELKMKDGRLLTVNSFDMQKAENFSEFRKWLGAD